MAIHSSSENRPPIRYLFTRMLLSRIDLLSDKRKAQIKFQVVTLLKTLSVFDEAHSGRIRFLLSRLLPWDPLSGLPSNPISLFVLTTKKDLAVLPLSLYSIIEVLSSEGGGVTIVCPESDIENVRLVTNSLRSKHSFEIKSDESILSRNSLKRMDFPNSHSLMQVMKFLCSIESTTDDCLVLDGDTVFFRNKVWSSGESMTLIVPPEYNQAHVGFVRMNFAFFPHHRLGFTTQSQLIRRSLILSLIESSGGLNKFVKIFTTSMKQANKHSFPCEWQLYGDWVCSTLGKKVFVSSYLNKSLVRSAVLDHTLENASFVDLHNLFIDLRRQFPSHGSISLHAYKN